MKKSSKKIFLVLLLIALIFNDCSSGSNTGTDLAELSKLGTNIPVLVKKEKYFKINRGMLSSLPVTESASSNLVDFDLRSYDLSSFDLTNYSNELKYTQFDSNTMWPKDLPSNFNPTKIMKLGCDPGLGIRTLHQQGIKGKGINIAIIDQALLVEHQEYTNNIMLYERLHCLDNIATMHGAAVASITLGQRIGVAPGAKLYYIASTFGEYDGTDFKEDLTYMAEGIKRILEINKHLSDKEKIRVISISRGFDNKSKGSDEVYDAIELAKKSNVFVITPNTLANYGFTLMGLGRSFMSDPNELTSYTPGLFWSDYYYAGKFNSENLLLVPMDLRTYASFTGTADYAFSSVGGASWSCPWLAGLYALCLQVDPKLKCEDFIKLAIQTGDEIYVENDGKKYSLKTVVNPDKLINAIEQQVAWQ